MASRSPRKTLAALTALLLATQPLTAQDQPCVLPQPKLVDLKQERIPLKAARIQAGFELGNEAEALREVLADAGVALDAGGTPIVLRTDFSSSDGSRSTYAAELNEQGYSITIGKDGVLILSPSPAGIFHGVQTFAQLIDDKSLPMGTIKDQPDIPIRMLMIDAARQNENMDYYRRVIDFAARYKMNAILCHLTDDQTSALYHEDYPELMHAHAWRPQQVRELVDYARKRHIVLIPEIESLGHSRMFTRLPDYESYLHKTAENNPDESWMGTNIPGFTNVLCPASDAAVGYLLKMYGTAADSFPHPWLHIGFDEVDMTTCSRCQEKFGDLTHDQWLAKSLQQASALATAEGKKTALWGDMLLAHPAVVDAISPSDTIIFDWHYNHDVKDDSVRFFKEKGFEIIASPSLVCAPHMIMPDEHNFQNIARFTAIAREHELSGINTTIWVPTRYMSDVLWTGVAWSAAHAWSGGIFDEDAFYAAFADDYFGTESGAEFRRATNTLLSTIWHRNEFNTGCWADQESLDAARKMAGEKRPEIEQKIAAVKGAREELARVGQTVTQHQWEWVVLEQSAGILQYSMEHLLASEKLPGDELLRELDAQCMHYIDEIEADWDRNRFAQDPGKDGLYLETQHLFHRFRQMHAFHQELLEAKEKTRVPDAHPGP
jgi:hypothetical protein